MYKKFTEQDTFNDLEPTELLIANEMISWQIAEMRRLWDDLNIEQYKIMTRYHELTKERNDDET